MKLALLNTLITEIHYVDWENYEGSTVFEL